MKSAAVVLLLLLSPSTAFGLVPTQEVSIRTRPADVRTEELEDSDLPPELPVIWNELVGLRHLVLSLQAVAVDQRQALRTTESRLRDSEEEVEHQRHVLDLLQVKMEADRKLVTELNMALRRSKDQSADEVLKMRSRLNISESSVEDLKKKTSALAADVPFLRARLRASERLVDELRRKSAAVMSRLCLMEDLRRRSSVDQPVLKEKNVRLQEAESRLDELSMDNMERLASPAADVAEGLPRLHSNVTSLDARLQLVENNLTAQTHTVSNLEDSTLQVARHLQEIRATVVTTLNNTWTLSEDMKARLSVLENLVEDLRTAKSVQSSQLSSMEVQLAYSHNNTAALEVTVRSAEAHVEELNLLNIAQAKQLSNMESRLICNLNDTAVLKDRLNVSEKRVEELKTEHTVSDGQLAMVMQSVKVIEGQVVDLWTKNTELKSRLEGEDHIKTVLQDKLNITDTKINKLKTTTEELMLQLRVLEQHSQGSGETKVAFSAALTDSGSVGPFDQETTLIFSKIFTNVGQAYDVTSGVFTAPVGGVYAFSFTTADFLKGYMGVTLYRNQQPIIFSLDLNDHGGYASVTNGVLLQLEADDQVRLSLPASYRLYDDARNFSIFSGFLLFPL
ncbi:putative leucine-rich repeat-containing protein DDB_G0290503 [Dunckerocampus dactyliophorus]|uniref:putative leucine-rich repeat-containing protein DDB_G0290503 n=1 Tax=Dunckerocampus dactyliophorus TaxID=161453 RepID=UPI0024060D5F|nr:putative leucine-rich repeat-containing protein DDB_G0290503 [Dunckerocampus dactyliophorus]XP_054652420.1 putative leucine-rich repeat-containing protein DDB_G0290503 [Dunckerocampus dactyliophorus]XP_054652421.1 putative leucine-rich repeat-containing protein DDB_G0290503 [Dunckerocampus dactyliophorus]XP_054652422.1 putative leucine-rich repeat-containing protein DDB_G0290503 [Dunckerocampus dactyliophorus]